MAWLLLAAFSQVSRAPKAEPKPLKNMKSGQILTVVHKGFVILKDKSVIKEKLIILC